MTQSKAQLTIFADIGNRIVALLLDLLLLTFVAGSAAGRTGLYVFPVFAFLYFAGMPLTPLQGSLGKWICRIKLCDRLGRRLSWRASAMRAGATICWFAPPVLLGNVSSFGGLESASLAANWWLIFALPWAPAGFLPRRESLFDLLAGSLVVRYSADTETIARAGPAQNPGVLSVTVNVLLCLVIGAVFSIMIGAHLDMNRRARVAYAITQTEPLRQKVEAFHVREQRWPTAGELGTPEWTPFRDGGGYRLQPDGSIRITFTVLPELKGHVITYHPTVLADGKTFRWQCRADTGLHPRYLPAECR